MWKELAAALPWITVIVAAIVLVLLWPQVRERLGAMTEVKYKDFSAKFDELKGNAFAAAADKIWKRPEDKPEYLTDPDFYFSDADFAAAKQFQSMMPIRRGMPITRLRVRRNIRALVYDLADQYRKVRAEPPSDTRASRMSSVVARMRILTFTAYPMVPELTAGHAGLRLAAIAFLQVKPCYQETVIVWLGDRLSPREERFVQYHAAGALLSVCRNAEAQHMEILKQIVRKATETCSSMREDMRSHRGLELVSWCQYSLDGKPFGRVGPESTAHKAEPRNRSRRRGSLFGSGPHPCRSPARSRISHSLHPGYARLYGHTAQVRRRSVEG
jgi:hypothetical protein